MNMRERRAGFWRILRMVVAILLYPAVGAASDDSEVPAAQVPLALFAEFEDEFCSRIDGACSLEDAFQYVGYDENGVWLRRDVANVAPEFEKLIARTTPKEIVEYFEHGRNIPNSNQYWTSGASAWGSSQVPLLMLGVLLRMSPQEGYRVANRILFSTHPIDGVPSFLQMEDTKYDRWPTLHRGCFYFLLNAQGAENEGQFLAKVIQACPCPFAMLDALLFEKATAVEKKYFRTHGEWPDPDVVPGCAVLTEAKKRAHAAPVKRLLPQYDYFEDGHLTDKHLFPDLPLFWCLKTWEDERVISGLVRLIAEAKSVSWALRCCFSWPEYGYICLRIGDRVEEFRKLANSEGLAAQVFGCAGVIDCLADEGGFDRELLDAALGRVIDEHAVGYYALRFLQHLWAPPLRRRVLEEHAEEWVALCGGSSKPPNALLLTAYWAAEAWHLAHPLDPMPGVDRAILSHIDQAVEGRKWETPMKPEGVNWQADYLIRLLALTRTERAFAWIKTRFASLPPNLRVEAIHACRHFGSEKLRELSMDTTSWSEAEKKALCEVTTAIECIEKAQRILAHYREKRVSLNEALLSVARVHHAAVVPWIWELVRGRGREIPAEARAKIAEVIGAENGLEHHFPERVLMARLRDEGFRVPMAPRGSN